MLLCKFMGNIGLIMLILSKRKQPITECWNLAVHAEEDFAKMDITIRLLK